MAATGVLLTLCNNVRNTLNNLDFSDDQITSWVRFAEERFNDKLRDVSMQKADFTSVQQNIISLPPDWVETIWLRFIANTANPTPVDTTDNDVTQIAYGRPLRPCTSDEFFTVTTDPNHPDHKDPLYMLNGPNLYLNPAASAVNGQQFEMGYYGQVIPLGNDITPLWARSTMLYTYAVLAHASAYDIEDERAAMWDTLVSNKINEMNEYTRMARFGTGPLHKRTRSFG